VNFLISQCQNCRGLITVILHVHGDDWAEWLVYPRSVPTVDDAVPKPVQADYIEGVECLGIGANKAAASMFRRSLQQVMIDKKAPAQKRLVDQIAALVEGGALPHDLGEWANEIRLWGNEGAHPSSDGLDKITKEETEEIQVFLTAYLSGYTSCRRKLLAQGRAEAPRRSKWTNKSRDGYHPAKGGSRCPGKDKSQEIPTDTIIGGEAK